MTLGVAFGVGHRIRRGRFGVEIGRLAFRDVTGTTAAREDLASSADRLFHRLIAGDEDEAHQLCSDLVERGVTVVDLLGSVVAPALREIGDCWQEGKLTIWAEHRASGIVERTLGRLDPAGPGTRKGTAVVATVSGERHGLPCTMAALALRDAGWRVDHLGVDTPEEELIDYCTGHDPDLVVISLTTPFATVLGDQVADRIRAMGIAAVVGGPGSSLADLITAADEVQSSGKQAARGV